MASIRIGLAALEHPDSVSAGVEKIGAMLCEARRRKVAIICTPETYLPGLRPGVGYKLPAPDQRLMEDALRELRARCRENEVAAIVGMEWVSELGLENRAFVISKAGRVLGYQTKNQITPGGESRNYVADGKRRVFRIGPLVFGIVVCHEGWRYPETVRWAVLRGARIVFQPQASAGDNRVFLRWHGNKATASLRNTDTWGASFYEKVMVCRAHENSIYFASVNWVMPTQSSHTSLIAPDGSVIAYAPYGKEALLAADIDPGRATRRYARRFNPALYPD